MVRKLISFDWAIKKILRSKAHFGILEGFLSELLFTDIRILEILESEGNQETQDNKFNRVDIKVTDSNERIIIIEVQYSRELDYLQRILYASAKVIVEHLSKSAAYADVSKVISVNILHFDLGRGDDYIYHGTTRFIGLHNQTELELSQEQKNLYTTETIADLYPEYYLIELRNFNDIARDTLDEWIYFLKNEEIKTDFSAKGLEEAKETLDVLKMNPEERLAYERHQEQLHYEASMYESTYVLGKMEGREEGREEGVYENKRQTVLLAHQQGMAIDMIASIVQLSQHEIKNILHEEGITGL
ncbi:Rpn family recombination-promoting nuclease/putative transposase [Candidatus Venteria ishoeyi]|uniref:Rpn family recombination-promoting nuclease/putative transposase n=1 Tax=Candidatus Venteria ishoeyi TaxID=1899563 RepID=UPI0025A68A4A|nr:Rpn family recombination-promoting nuclease/putative transposase [Candidatus Venteria ishoeyi]MDM8545127.1 Rpn family recombination-promoting nuclease/putative transposase [Candidatus Venteria ishoeyi]